MKIAIITCLPAKWDMKIESGHPHEITQYYGCFSKSCKRFSTRFDFDGTQ